MEEKIIRHLNGWYYGVMVLTLGVLCRVSIMRKNKFLYLNDIFPRNYFFSEVSDYFFLQFKFGSYPELIILKLKKHFSPVVDQ